MASANQRKAKFISKKLKFLKNQRDHLINDVGLYVSRIITAGESWVEGGDNKLEYLELCHMIDVAVQFLCEKCEQLAGGTVDVAVNQLSRPSCEQSNLATQVITGIASSSATSNRQTAAPLSSTATASYNQSAVSVQPADETQLKPAFARIAVIEEALCSFRGNAEQVAEQQSCTDQQLKELLTKLSESDKKHSSRFRNVKEQISDVQDAINEEYKTRFQSLERQLQKVPTAQDAINEEHKTRLQSLERQLQKVSTAQEAINEEHKRGLQSLERQLQKVSTAQEAINEEHKTRLQSLERQLQKVSTAQDRLDREMELQVKLVEKLVHFPNQLEAVKENIDELDARIERIIDECRIKHEDIKTVTHDLVNKVTANTRTIQVISEGQEQKMTLLRELETRLKTLEADSGRHVKDFQKQAEQGETNLSKVIQEVAVMSPRFQHLELKASGPGCGFNASKWFSDCIDGVAITEYNVFHSTVGSNFDADSGIFTAPSDGLYVVSVSLMLPENEKLQADVKRQPNLSEESTIVCWCSAALKDTTACSVSVVHLKVGDKLFVSVDETLEIDSIYVKFTCFLLR